MATSRVLLQRDAHNAEHFFDCMRRRCRLVAPGSACRKYRLSAYISSNHPPDDVENPLLSVTPTSAVRSRAVYAIPANSRSMGAFAQWSLRIARRRMAIVGRLADLLGHQVQVHSRAGRSVFRVLVPRGDSQAIVVQNEAPPCASVGNEYSRLTTRPTSAMRLRACSANGGALHSPPTIRKTRFADPRLRPMQSSSIFASVTRRRADAIRALRRRFGRVPALLVSGASTAAALARIEASGVRLLHKPSPPVRL